MLILGIESSCDDAAAAVIETTRPGVATIRSSVIANQDEIHRRYGGVVPELASRNHVVTILPVIEQALEAAGCALGDIGGIAVTRGPGLVGSLLVGLMCAKGLAQSLGIAMVGVNHIEGHLLAPLLEHRARDAVPRAGRIGRAYRALRGRGLRPLSPTGPHARRRRRRGVRQGGQADGPRLSGRPDNRRAGAAREPQAGADSARATCAARRSISVSAE